MTVRFGMSTPNASNGRHLLLGGWRGVVEDVRRLSADLRHARGTCACGHAASEPGGTCPCCQTGVSQTVCRDCGAQVTALGEKLSTLVADTLRFLPVMATLFDARGATREATQLHSIQVQIGSVERTFRRLASASAEFRRGCPASHFKAVAAVADDLLCQVWVLQEVLEPGTARWAELHEIERERG